MSRIPMTPLMMMFISMMMSSMGIYMMSEIVLKILLNMMWTSLYLNPKN